MISVPNDWLIYVDNSKSSMKSLNILLRSILSLQLSWRIVLVWLYSFHKSICSIEFFSKILSQKWSANLELTLTHQLILYFSKLKWMLRTIKFFSYDISRPLMQLVKPWNLGLLFNELIRICFGIFLYSHDSTKFKLQSLCNFAYSKITLFYKVYSFFYFLFII